MAGNDPVQKHHRNELVLLWTAVCMLFPPKDKRKVVTSVFPCFKMNNLDLKYVDEFKYLGHSISNNERDDNNVLRQVRAMFARTNILARRFSSCSVSVKTVLFRSYCIWFFMVWNSGSVTVCQQLIDCDLIIQNV